MAGPPKVIAATLHCGRRFFPFPAFPASQGFSGRRSRERTAVLKHLLLASGVGLSLTSILLFTLGHRLRLVHWFASLGSTVVLIAASIGVFNFFSAVDLPMVESVAAGAAIAALFIALFPSWNPVGHAAFTAIAISAGVFLAYAGFVISAARLGPLSLAFALLLFILQSASVLLLLAHTFEILDVVCRRQWARASGARRIPGYQPMVSIHVPAHNEPPALVIETLNRLAELEYENYEVLVIDNNTQDESLWRPLEEHCRRLGPRFRFFHLLPWPGFKSGALNYALTQTAKDAEIVAIVDADYLVRRNYLADLVGYFDDEKVAFVQTPQDYRDGQGRGLYVRALYLSYLYFFKVSMASRNEHNAIIFAGTMGMIRRRALEEIGGWDEWCITEDAEIALRLLDRGWLSHYVDESYGQGLMPLDYAGLKKQRFRWAFGGMQLLRMHGSKLVNPFRRTKLDAAQKFAYISGGLQWLSLGGEITAQGNEDLRAVQAGAMLEWAFMRSSTSLQLRGGVGRTDYEMGESEESPYLGIGFYRRF
jgi:glycosyltransferase involved in cell wall biosynthesis